MRDAVLAGESVNCTFKLRHTQSDVSGSCTANDARREMNCDVAGTRRHNCAVNCRPKLVAVEVHAAVPCSINGTGLLRTVCVRHCCCLPHMPRFCVQICAIYASNNVRCLGGGVINGLGQHGLPILKHQRSALLAAATTASRTK